MNPLISKLQQLIAALAFLFITAIIILGLKKPIKLKAHPELLHNLVMGNDRGYVIPGHELNAFKPYLPENGVFSFIMDFPYVDADEHADLREFFWQAQNNLAPIVLNRHPGETRAIVFCSSDEIAEKQMKDAGYKWLQKIDAGKGIAIRQ